MRRVQRRKSRKIILAIFTLFCLVLILYFSVNLSISLKKFFESKKIEIINPSVSDNSLIDFKNALEKNRIETDYILLATRSGDIVAKIKDGPRVLFSKKEKVDYQVSTLQLIIQKLTIDGRKISDIDLRFDKPIVKW